MDDLKKQIQYLQEQISRQEHLASLGMLSAGIAHEIQNPLNFVINFSKLSLKLVQDMEEALLEVSETLPEITKEEIDDILADLKGNMLKIEENGSRASGIVRGILLHSRGKDDAFMQTDLRQLVHEYTWLSYHAMRANHKSFNASIQETYEEGLPALNVVPQDLSRAVINIMNNACYAVFAKAKEASDAPYQPTINIDLKKEGGSIKLTIEDNGTGIPDEVKEKLYTPFFTTKPVGEGTGLGLSISKSIIEEKHHGKLVMETEPGKYTRFTITLPVQQ